MADFRLFSPCWGDISFTEAPRTTARCYAGAIFLSRSPFGATARARGVAWPRCRWAAAGPGRTTSQRTEPHASTPGPTGMEGAGGTGGPGCGASGRRQGQGGPRDRPLRAVRLACGDLAGGPPPTGTQSSPARQHTTRRPEHQRSHKQQHTARTARGRPGPPVPRTPAAQHAT